MEANAKIRLSVDDKEYRVRMQQAQVELQDLRKEAESMRPAIASWNQALTGFNGALQSVSSQAEQIAQEMLMAYNNLISKALDYSTVSEGNVKALQDYITTQGYTIEMVENSIAALDEETARLAINSEAWQKGMAASTNLKGALGGVIKEQTKYAGVNANTVPGVNQMRMAMNQLGYVLNDSQMFMVNARMGIMGISNNLPMIIQLMRDAKEAAGGKANMMKLLSSSLMGGGGLIIGLNALLLALTVLPDLFTASKESMKELAKESEDLAKKLAELEEDIPGFNYSSIEMSFKKQNEYNDAVDKSIEKAKKLRDEKEKELKLLREPITRVVRGEPVTIQRGETEEIKKVTAELEDYETKLTGLINKKEFFNGLLDRTQGKLVGLDERIKTQNITAAEWKNLISRMTDNEISALTGSLNKSNSEIQRGSEEYKTATANLELLKKQMDSTKKKDASKTYEQLLAERIKYYDELTKLDAKSYAAYKSYLDQQLFYYSEILNKQQGGFQNFTTAQLEGYNLIKQKLKEIKELSKAPDIDLGQLEMEDVEFNPDKVKEDQEAMKRLRIDSIKDSLAREQAIIKQWYSEQTELDLYKQNDEAKRLIDQQYYNKLDELRQQRVDRERESYKYILNEGQYVFQTIADLQMSGAEKWESISRRVYSTIVVLFWKALSELIVTKSLELATHTATEAAKTASTIAQTAIRSEVRASEAMAGGSGGSSSGGGGFLGTLLGIGGTILSWFGFEKGGAIVGENGPELIAPIESYADANRMLVTRTVLAVQGSLKDLQLQQAGTFSSKGLEGLLGGHIEAINKWQREIQLRVRGGDLKSAMDNMNSYYNKLEVG